MAWKAGTNRRAGALPPSWPQTRRLVLARDHGRCVFCGAPATDVDHIDDPNDHRTSNLRALCQPCHMRRTAAQSHASRRRGGWTKGKRRKFRAPTPHPGDRRQTGGEQGSGTY